MEKERQELLDIRCEVTIDGYNDFMSVIRYESPNADTIAAIEEVQKLKADPNKKTYGSFLELLGDLDNE